MKAQTLCIPCLLQQAYRTVRIATSDEALQRRYLREVARFAADASMDCSPAEYSTPLYLTLSEMLGVADVFEEVKRRQNAAALVLIDRVEAAVRRHPDPLVAAARVAGAGNLIDSGTGVPDDVERALIAAADRPFARDESAEFFRKLADGAVRSLLYICDNAGEIVFDCLFVRILKERFPALRITAAVKGIPILNDATLADAQESGMDRAADALVTTGIGRIGAPLDKVGPEFREAFDAADLFLSKGQGNFETLDEEPGGYLVLSAKCAAVARELQVQEGQMAFVASGPK